MALLLVTATMDTMVGLEGMIIIWVGIGIGGLGIRDRNS